MALEAVVFSQDPFSYISCKDFVFQDLYFQDQEDIKNTIKLGQEQEQDQDQEQDQEQGKGKGEEFVRSKNGDDEDYKEEDLHVYRSTANAESQAQGAGGGRRKRRRTRSSKNKEEMENQRMAHIAVERNRRKQMNDYLAVLRSLMPPSYAQRGDQASIIGGAINYVKELEHLLQSMESSKTKSTTNETDQTNTTSASKVPFSDFFTFPQYSTRSSSSAAAEIEVTMVESHANLKILVKKRPRQLIKLVASIQSLKLTLLHLNVTTLHLSVLYSISVKVEEGSQLNTVEDIAAVVNQILRRIEEEFSSSSSLSSLSSSFS